MRYKSKKFDRTRFIIVQLIIAHYIPLDISRTLVQSEHFNGMKVIESSYGPSTLTKAVDFGLDLF